MLTLHFYSRVPPKNTVVQTSAPHHSLVHGPYLPRCTEVLSPQSLSPYLLSMQSSHMPLLQDEQVQSSILLSQSGVLSGTCHSIHHVCLLLCNSCAPCAAVMLHATSSRVIIHTTLKRFLFPPVYSIEARLVFIRQD